MMRITILIPYHTVQATAWLGVCRFHLQTLDHHVDCKEFAKMVGYRYGTSQKATRVTYVIKHYANPLSDGPIFTYVRIYGMYVYVYIRDWTWSSQCLQMPQHLTVLDHQQTQQWPHATAHFLQNFLISFIRQYCSKYLMSFGNNSRVLLFLYWSLDDDCMQRKCTITSLSLSGLHM